MADDLRVGNTTVRFTGSTAQVVERRRKVGHLTLACEYVCGLLDSDESGRCWSYDHAGPRCAPAEVAPGQDEAVDRG